MYNYFIGIDISKLTLDIVLVKQGQLVLHEQIENDLKAIKSFMKRVRQQPGFTIEQTLACMEHTGIYATHLLDYLTNQQVDVWLENALQIKKSGGIQRGKNDKVDAYRIALYAYRNCSQVRLWQPPRQVIQQLTQLTSMRSRLLNVIKQLSVPLQEHSLFVSMGSKALQKACCNSLKALKQDLAKIEKQIAQLIAADEELNRLFNLVTSVEGVGKVTAVQILLTTNEFKASFTAKKYACYAGVAPFPYRSGSSIKGRNRVSPLANKSVKTLLHLAALSAIKAKGELREYFLRKVAEGKNKMAVVNAVRNKLITRIFAVVKQNRKYEKNYTYSVV
ncbi:IS110 family transposase [Rhodocytophaga aerolata]|uniref:IS110 family transposase n=1 Tax=Rhodocytophaga aerolata TaxID=455078 RepID=A0ABT8R003_9BACT|nr:IS110 family transposase [Rhodocytophaga aerolata]MDO1444638.1 IS110 family transposase [Rhodocytophaga aerolata]